MPLIAPPTPRVPAAPSTARTAIQRAMSESGHIVRDGERVDQLLPRQAVFELTAVPGSAHAVTPMTPAAEAALRAPGNRLGSVLSTWAGLVDAADGARLRGVILTDSAKGMRLADDIAMLDAGLGMKNLSTGEIGDFLKLLNRDLTKLPAAHTITNGSRPEPGEEHYAWIVVGDASSADIMHFAGVTPRLHSSWPDRMTNNPDAVASVAALTADLMAHEGTHAKLSRSHTQAKGDVFPSALDEARTELANSIAPDPVILTRALGADPVKAIENQAKPLAQRSYGSRVTWLADKLDARAVSKDPAERLKFIHETSIWDLRDQVGVPG